MADLEPRVILPGEAERINSLDAPDVFLLATSELAAGTLTRISAPRRRSISWSVEWRRDRTA